MPGVVGAFCLGSAGVVVARWGRAALTGGVLAGDTARTLMLIDAGAAIAVGLPLMLLFRLGAKPAILAQAAGVVAMLALMQIHAAPADFAMIASD